MCYAKCDIFNASLHTFHTGGDHKGKGCFNRYQYGKHFGFCRYRITLVGKHKREWKVTSYNKQGNCVSYIKGILSVDYSNKGMF